MTTSLFPFLLNPALALTGVIAPSAKLAFYLTNTTTLATVYDADSDPISQAANGAGVVGVEADAFGRFPSIYLDDSVTYRVILRTASGVQVGDEIDPYQSTIGEFAGTAGSGLVGFSQAATYPAGTLGKHDQASAYFEDAPYNAKGDGTTDDTAAILAGGVAAQATRGVINARKGSRYRLNSNVSFSGTALAIHGPAGAPLQTNATLPAAAFLGYGTTGPMITIGANASFSDLRDFAIENRNGNTSGILFTSCVGPQIEGISALNYGSAYPRLDALFDTDTSAFAYMKARRLTVYSTACKEVFRCGKQNGDPTQFPTTLSLQDCPELAAVDGVSMKVFTFPSNRFESLSIKNCTFDAYGGAECLVIDASDNASVVDFNTNYANGNVDFNGELDVSQATASDKRFFKFDNTAYARLEGTITSGGSMAAIASARNTKVLVQNLFASSLNGPIVDVQDFETLVDVGPGVTLQQANTLGVFNSSVVVAGSNFTAATVNGSMIVTVSSPSGKVWPGMPYTGGGGTLADGYILRQLSGVKWGAGTYAVSAPATATGSVSLSQASGTYANNAGIHTVPRFVDGSVNYYFIETWRAENGVHTFKIAVTDAAAFTILVSSNFLNNPKPLSHRSRGLPLNIVVENRSGGVLGTVTLGSNIQLSAAVAPANNKAASFTIGMDISISGSTVTEYFRQIGGIDQAIPLF